MRVICFVSYVALMAATGCHQRVNEKASFLAANGKGKAVLKQASLSETDCAYEREQYGWWNERTQESERLYYFHSPKNAECPEFVIAVNRYGRKPIPVLRSTITSTQSINGLVDQNPAPPRGQAVKKRRR